MALSARPAATAATPNVASGHMPSGGRNVASATYAPIEELSANVHVQPDPNFNFQGFSDGRGGRQHQQEPLRNYGGNLDTNSSTFVSLLDQAQPQDTGAEATKGLKGGFQSLLSRAIRAYEGTSAVIHGTVQPRGTSYSATL